jgi:two-component system response regulator YesN
VLTAYKIIEYLTSHIDEQTDLLDVSHDLNLSIFTFKKKVKQLTGFSLHKLHEKLKIEKAKLMLNSNMTITEIADKLGFQNQFYFSNVFKKNTGVSPKKWVE